MREQQVQRANRHGRTPQHHQREGPAAVGDAPSLLTAAVVIVSVRVLGVLLIAAAVVIPGALARLVTRSFPRMLAVATGVGAVSGVIGLYASFHADIPSGPAIVLVGAALFALALFGLPVGFGLMLLHVVLGAVRRSRP